MWGFWPSPGLGRSRRPEGDRDKVLCRNYTGTGADERGEETSEFCHSWDVFTPLEGAAGHRSVPAAGWKVDGEEVPQLHWLLSLLLLQCSSVGGEVPRNPRDTPRETKKVRHQLANGETSIPFTSSKDSLLRLTVSGRRKGLTWTPHSG